jgi:hypothetical protein
MIRRLVLAACLALMVAPAAFAIPFVDSIPHLQFMDTPLESHLFVFDLDNDVLATGDVNPLDTINSAFLSILFGDDQDLENEASWVVFDGEVALVLPVVTPLWTADVYAQVVDDHYLEVTVVRASGDFWLGTAVVWGDVTPIPEPTSMLMLGGLSAGVAGARKLRKKK